MIRRAAPPVLIAVSVLVMWVVPQFFPADGGPTGLDRELAQHIRAALDGHAWAYRVLVAPSDATAVVALLLAGAGWFAYRGQWWQAAFVIVAPEVAMLINGLVLKPLWDRPLHSYLAYPSGHTVHLVAVVTAVALAGGSMRIRVTALVVMAVILPAVTVGMVGLGYHHPTDVIGGTAAALALVTAMYLPVRSYAVRVVRTG